MSVLVAGCGWKAGGPTHVHTPGPEALAVCTVRETSRTRLTVEGGRPLYVQADAFVANGRGDVLLAGTTSYLWQVSAEGQITGVKTDSVFGAVIARDGGARSVPAPIPPRQIHGIRAAGRDDHRWDVVFAEVAPYTGDRKPEEALRLWYGVYDGQGWTGLEEIPTPEGTVLDALFNSSLVRQGDTLAWALRPAMGSARGDVLLVQRHEGRWSYQWVPTRVASDVELSYSDSSGLLLGVVQPDPSMRSDGNSLLLWAQRPEWRIVRRLVHGTVDGRVFEPWLRRLPAGLVTSWTTPVGEGPQTRQELRAMLGDLESGTGPAVVLDSDVSIWSEAAPLVQAQGFPVWVAHHSSPDGGSDELRFIGVPGDSAVELGRVANPYRMRGAAVALAHSELLVTGMEYLQEGFAFSLLLRARVRCSGEPEADSRAQAHPASQPQGARR